MLVTARSLPGTAGTLLGGVGLPGEAHGMREGVFASPGVMSKVSLDKASPPPSPFLRHQAPADPTHGSSQNSLYAGTQCWCGTLRTCSQPWESFQVWERERSSTLLFFQCQGTF